MTLCGLWSLLSICSKESPSGCIMIFETGLDLCYEISADKTPIHSCTSIKIDHDPIIMQLESVFTVYLIKVHCSNLAKIEKKRVETVSFALYSVSGTR